MKLRKTAYLTQTSMTVEELFNLVACGYEVFIMNPELYRNIKPFLDLALYQHPKPLDQPNPCIVHVIPMDKS